MKAQAKPIVFFAYYRQLMKSRRLVRFCREAFIEKVDRSLNEVEELHILLNSHIKLKGIPYILDAIREKETRSSSEDIGEVEIEKAANQIIQKLMKALQDELQTPTPVNSLKTINLPKKKPDIEKLMAFL